MSAYPYIASEGDFGSGQLIHRAAELNGDTYETACGKSFGPDLDAAPGWGVGGPVADSESGEPWTVPTCASCRGAAREHFPYKAQVLDECAAWIESLASPTLANDPFIRAADWAAKLIREYASQRSD